MDYDFGFEIIIIIKLLLSYGKRMRKSRKRKKLEEFEDWTTCPVKEIVIMKLMITMKSSCR